MSGAARFLVYLRLFCPRCFHRFYRRRVGFVGTCPVCATVWRS